MSAHSNRFDELEQRFSELESKLKNTPEKEAISVLHALMHESRRQASQARAQQSPPSSGSSGELVTLEDIANLYKSAPGMEGAAENEGLPVGVPAPDFALPDAEGTQVSLSEFRGRSVLLVFYPLDWSPACSDQLSLYQSERLEFDRYDVQVLGISVDSLYSHGAWSAVRGLTFPLLADFHPKGEVARRYQVWRDASGFSERALYLVDREGTICYKHISPELHRIPSIYELFDALKSLPPVGGKRSEEVR